MHWERKHVNPLLALRNAVCNDRWQEMWQKALKQHRQQQTLHRTSRAEQRTQALLSVGNSSSVEFPSHSAAASEHISPPAPCQPASKALSPSVPPPVPEASQPRSGRLSSRRKRHIARNRVKCSHHKSSEVNADVCPCGTPLVRFKGHRPKQYCSDRCRQRAHRKRLARITSRLSLAQRLNTAARPEQRHKQVLRSPQPFVRVSADACPCGTPLVQCKGHRGREYCSDRCRQRASRARRVQLA